MQTKTLTMHYHHRHHDQNDRRCLDSRRKGRFGKHAYNEGRFPHLQSIPEDKMQEVGLEQSQLNMTLRKRHDTSSTLPPLFPRHYPQILPTPTVNDDDEITPYEMVNLERRKRGLLPFRLSRSMNHLATQQAYRMAKNTSVYHSASTIDALKVLLKGIDVAENIQRGDKISTMHIETMRATNCVNRSNVLSTYFSEFGYGVATGPDGKVYCCQLFRS